MNMRTPLRELPKLSETAKQLQKKKPAMGFSCTPRCGETVRSDCSHSAQSLLRVGGAPESRLSNKVESCRAAGARSSRRGIHARVTGQRDRRRLGARRLGAGRQPQG